MIQFHAACAAHAAYRLSNARRTTARNTPASVTLTNDSIVTSSPTVVDGKLYIGSGDKFYPMNKQGRIYVFDVP